MRATVSVEPTTQDVLGAVAVAMGARRWLRLAALVFIVGGLTVIGYVLLGPLGLSAGLIVGCAFVMSVLLAARRKARQQAERARRGLTITVDESGLLSETPETRAELAWSTFRSAQVTKDHLYLRVRPGAVFYIPLRCFETPDAQELFIGIVAEHLSVKGRPGLELTPVPPTSEGSSQNRPTT